MKFSHAIISVAKPMHGNYIDYMRFSGQKLSQKPLFANSNAGPGSLFSFRRYENAVETGYHEIFTDQDFKSGASTCWLH